MVPTVRVVFCASCRSICKLPCKIYGTRNCGETREMSGAAWNNGEFDGRIFGKVGACWFGGPPVYCALTSDCCEASPFEITAFR